MDQNVPTKYLQALRDADGITVAAVDEVLEHDATDRAIADHAEADGWVVLTGDDDFYVERGEHGLLFFHQVEDPAPGAVVEAIRRIDAAYDSAAAVVETVPDGWT